MPKLSKADQAAKVSANEARRRKELALCEIREMERDRLRDSLIPADQVEQAWDAIRTTIRAAILRLPDKCAPRYAEAKDARTARALLQEECEQILREISDGVRGCA